MNPPTLPASALCVLIGPPGSGKSTLAACYPDTWRVCLDVYRGLATDSEADQSATPVAAQIQALLLDARLSRGLTTLVDSTNLLPHVRAGHIARARYWQRPVVAVLFDVPLATAEERNARRDRVVPRHIVRELHQLLPEPEQLRAEGFDTVHLASEIPSTAGALRWAACEPCRTRLTTCSPSDPTGTPKETRS